eukprot:2959223-Pyramimonas_sp.AAC.1
MAQAGDMLKPFMIGQPDNIVAEICPRTKIPTPAEGFIDCNLLRGDMYGFHPCLKAHVWARSTASPSSLSSCAHTQLERPPHLQAKIAAEYSSKAH